MSVSSAFDQFRQALEIDQETIDDAIELHETARKGLKDRLDGHKRTFLSGSYPRNTRLDPLDDIDIIAVVESTEAWEDDPEKAMEAAGDAVRPDFPGSTIRLGAHAAKLKPKDPTIPEVHLDIVVARETGDGTVLEISEREPESNWRKSDPEAHANARSETNDAWEKRLKPTIKQIKHWNRNTAGEPLPSFLIEALGLRIFTGEGDLSASEMVQKFFDGAKEAICTPTTSPAVPDGYVDGDMTESEREAHSRRLAEASDTADDAVEAEEAGDESAAQEIWYGLFGDPFPKPDKEERKAKIAEALRAGTVGVGAEPSLAAPAVPSFWGGHTVPKRARRAVGSASQHRGPRKRAPLAQRMVEHRTLEAGVRDAYDLARLVSDHLTQHYVWRVPVVVPGYGSFYRLRVELSEDEPVHVTAEDWSGPMKHTFGHNRLCMWFPSDPPERRWQRSDGLLKLIDTAVVHLFKELYWRETGEWLGEEAPHELPKVDARVGEVAA